MALLVSMLNQQLTLTATDTSYLASNAKIKIMSAVIANPGATNETATVYKVPVGGTAGTANIILPAKTILAGDTYECPQLIGQVLVAGEALQAIASTAAKLNFIVSGVVF